jgi:hypothetical protein
MFADAGVRVNPLASDTDGVTVYRTHRHGGRRLIGSP